MLIFQKHHADIFLEQTANGGATWTNLSTGNGFIGTQTTTLINASAGTALNGDYFRVVFSNSVGTSNSAPAKLIVNSNYTYASYLDSYDALYYAEVSNAPSATLSDAEYAFSYAYYAYYYNSIGEQAAAAYNAYYAYYFSTLAYYSAYADWVGSGYTNYAAYDSYYYSYFAFNYSYDAASGL